MGFGLTVDPLDDEEEVFVAVPVFCGGGNFGLLPPSTTFGAEVFGGGGSFGLISEEEVFFGNVVGVTFGGEGNLGGGGGGTFGAAVFGWGGGGTFGLRSDVDDTDVGFLGGG